MKILQIKNLFKSYKEKKEMYKVWQDLNLEIEEGKFVTIFGPNGSGKSTLLNLIAGLEIPDSGSVLINKKSPKDSKIGFVFQNFNESMLPWRTVEGNIRLAYEGQVDNKFKDFSITSLFKKEKFMKESCEKILQQTELENIRKKFFFSLSGGQKQLTAIARCFAFSPELMLLDEPFSALDYAVTKKMQLKILDLWQNYNRERQGSKKLTVLFVSHDLDEAIFLADEVLVLSPRPAKIKSIIKVNLPRPRTLDMLESQDFFNLRKQILNDFKHE